MKILLDALYINNSGGKVLLDSLVKELHAASSNVFFLLDSRVKDSFPYLSSEHVLYLPNSIKARHQFYKYKGHEFDKVLCFGNIPPTIRLKAKVFTYFHNTIFFYTTSAFTFKERIICSLKARFIRTLKCNTDEWWVQTSEVAKLFEKYWNIPESQTRLMPFYQIDAPAQIDLSLKDPHTFLYVSDGHPNKLHTQLIEAFVIIQSQFPKAKLLLTISEQYPELIQQIHNLQSKGIQVFNLGWCNAQKLSEVYQSSSYFVFPSNQESFGLGLIEAAKYGLKILAADLPYVHAIIEPSLTFDPLSVNQIQQAMENALSQPLKESKLLIKSELEKIVNTLIA